MRRDLAALGLMSLAALGSGTEEMDIYPWERLDSIRARHERLCGEVAQALVKLREIREAFPDSLEKASLITESDAIWDEQREWQTEANKLRRDYRDSVDAIKLSALARGLQKHKSSLQSEKTAEVTARILLYERASNEMKGAEDKLSDAFEAERALSYQMADAHRTLLADRRDARRWGGGALGAVLLGVLAYFVGRRRNPGRALAAPSGTPLVAENFEIIRMIGKGGMGMVFEARDRALDRKVAIKIMRDELLNSPKELNLFLEEARMVASLKHPNLVEIHSVVRETDRVYLVFEHIAGKTLHRVIDERKRLTLKEAGFVLACMASALDYAHSRRVIHRDLKPANVMISTGGAVKIMDFGIAYQAKKTIARLTRQEAWGTPPYMAPEQELGGVAAGVDLYAMLVCFYEMLTGELPFAGPNFLAQKREEFFRKPREIVPALPAGIDAFFQKGFAAEPARRYQSGSEIVSALAAMPGAGSLT